MSKQQLKEGENMDTAWMTEKELAKAVELLIKGEVVAFPTETVYGLGADATNDEAVKKIFLAKGRPSDNPLIIHVSDVDQVYKYATKVPEKAKQVMDHFWPGPCTIILKRKGKIAQTVTAGLDSVAMRMPDHLLALKLIEKSGVPLAAPSANLSGKPSPTSAEHVRQDLDGRISAIIDGGETGWGIESTVLDLTDPEKPVILRPGGISREELEEVIGPVELDRHQVDQKEAPKSPGMKYTHYSPKEPIFIIEQNWEKAIKHFQDQEERVGIIASEQVVAQWKEKVTTTFSLGDKKDKTSAAHLLYKGLRSFENTEATVILAETYPKEGIGEAYMNRLERAAGNKRL